MVLELGGGLFGQRDVRETPATTSSSSSSTSILAPIGSIIAWLKSYANTPQALPTGWMEADGSAINDADSVYDGQNAPDLNGGEFIRGAATSGGTGGSDTMAHTHGVTSNVTVGNHTTLTINGHSAHTTLVMGNHTSLALNNHTNLALSNHAALNISNDSHTHGLSTAANQALEGPNIIRLLSSTTDNDTHDHGFSQNINAHSFSQNITPHSFSTNISAHSFTQNIDAHSAHVFGQNISNHSVTNNAVTSGAASNTENRPKYYNVVWIFRFK